MCKHLQFHELEVIEFHAARLLFDAGVLGITADAGDRFGDIDGGTEAGGEEAPLQVDLSIRDRDEIRGNIGGYLSLLGLNDRQGRHAAAAMGGVKRGAAFQQTRMKREDIARIGLSSGRAA